MGACSDLGHLFLQDDGDEPGTAGLVEVIHSQLPQQLSNIMPSLPPVQRKQGHIA